MVLGQEAQVIEDKDAVVRLQVRRATELAIEGDNSGVLHPKLEVPNESPGAPCRSASAGPAPVSQVGRVSEGILSWFIGPEAACDTRDHNTERRGC